MVRAGSLQHIEKKKKIKQYLLGGLLLLVLVIVAGLFFLRGSDSESKDFSVSDELRNNIASLDFKVSQPATLPDGFSRSGVKIISANQSVTGCQEVLQNYTKTSNTAKDYIDIYTYSPECSYERPEDAEGFSIGDYAGWVSDSNKEFSILYEITVLEAMVRIETDQTRKDMETVLKKFEPFK